ncbi:zinc-ribbon domain-containing protein [Polaribacter sp.]|uniref:zinc ribbon domain-containing protein n=1 Tax=Polaribacter sp. TaxID=1920175 RepID=UPI003EF77FAC
MAYCTNCGTDNKNNSKFCPNCGTAITEDLKKNKRRPPPKRKMKKGVVKSIENEATNSVKSKLKETVAPKTPKSSSPISEVFESKKKTTTSATELQIEDTNKFNKWTWIYAILNGLLLLLGIQSEEVTGVLIFSILILGIVFFRRKKEKPYNLLTKIVLVLQLLLLIAIIVEDLAYFSVVTLLLIGLFASNIILLFKGNK